MPTRAYDRAMPLYRSGPRRPVWFPSRAGHYRMQRSGRELP